MSTSQLDAKAIFNVARKIHDLDARQQYLQQVCGADLNLRDRVEMLLLGFEKDSQFLLFPAVDLRETFTVPPPPEVPGAMIGPYKVREQLGEGGMGVVYVAEQAEPIRRKVALKIIKPGMDSQQVIARFEAERQALAMMSHPNIAKVLDGGTTENGRPYFVMELVKGVPITKFCDEHKLSLRSRLELFVTVCQAVQHAHLKGIIHRDLKPSNVLVELHDVNPVAKVIDFGIAKATNQQLTQKTIYTQFSQLVGTPLYMSPEQAQLSGLDIDTRSDVYSLGVMLYELLAGATPFDKSTLSSVGLDEMLRVIREEDPPLPSYKVSTLEHDEVSTISVKRQSDPRRLSIAMKRELDWIVMKALEKDRTRRYESASDLAEDIQRYLNDEAVRACPPSVGYKLKKYAKRHKGLLTTMSLMTATLLIATGVSVSYAVQAEVAREDANQEKEKAVAAEKTTRDALNTAKEEQRKAEENLNAALDSVDKLLAHASSPELAEIPQTQKIQREILQDVLAFYEKFRVTTGDSESLRVRAAKTWDKLAGTAADLQDRDLNQKAYAKSLELLEALETQFPKNTGYRYLVTEKLLSHGYTLAYLHRDPQSARRDFERALGRTERLLIDDPQNAARWSSLKLIALHGLATTALKMNDNESYRKYMMAIDELFEKLGSTTLRHEPEILAALGNFFRDTDQKRAAEYYRKAVEKSRDFIQKHPTRFHQSEHTGLLAGAIEVAKDADPQLAIQWSAEAVEIAHPLAIDYPDIPIYQLRLKNAVGRRVDLLTASATHRDTIAVYAEFVERFPEFDWLHERLARQLQSGPDPTTSLSLAIVQFPQEGIYYRYRGKIFQEQNKPEQALSDFNRAADLLADTDPPLFKMRAEVFIRSKQFDKALADLNQYVELGKDRPHSHYIRGEFYAEQLKDYQNALADLNRSFELYPSVAYRYKTRAYTHFRLNMFDEALADVAKGLELDPSMDGALRCISTSDVANCPDPSFGEDMLAIADKAVENHDSADMRVARATLLAALKLDERAEADFKSALKSAPEEAWHYPYYLAFLAERERWEDVRSLLDKFTSLESAGCYQLYQAALVSASLNDADRHRSYCHKMLAAPFADLDNDKTSELHFVAWTCSLAPNALEDYSSAIQLSQQALNREPENQQYLNGLGAIQLRAGKPDVAKKQLTQALEASHSQNTSTAYVRYFLAMTEHALGNQEEAKRHLQTANELAAAEMTDSPAWNRKLTLELLRKEAEVLIIEPAMDGASQIPPPR